MIQTFGNFSNADNWVIQSSICSERYSTSNPELMRSLHIVFKIGLLSLIKARVCWALFIVSITLIFFSCGNPAKKIGAGNHT